MSHDFVPVQWNRQKYIYDALLLAGTFIFLASFMVLGMRAQAADMSILMIRAFGSCAIVLLHIILFIGPLARLSDRFKPLLYNRRHFGVITAIIALLHGAFALMWYHGFGTINPIASALGGYGDYGTAIEFPFESLGLIALIILLIMAATSHDFWLSRLTPPMWKSLHMSVYFAYAALVGHVALGAAQFDKGWGLFIALAIGALLLSLLHVAAILKGRGLDKDVLAQSVWINVGAPLSIPMNKAITVTPPSGERIAIFRHAKGISAIVAVCSHQNGPLGEGCIRDGLVTCPWHGFQFDPETGAAPPPFTDRVQTHKIIIEKGDVWVNTTPDILGTTRLAVQVKS